MSDIVPVVEACLVPTDRYDASYPQVTIYPQGTRDVTGLSTHMGSSASILKRMSRSTRPQSASHDSSSAGHTGGGGSPRRTRRTNGADAGAAPLARKITARVAIRRRVTRTRAVARREIKISHIRSVRRRRDETARGMLVHATTRATVGSARGLVGHVTNAPAAGRHETRGRINPAPSLPCICLPRRKPPPVDSSSLD